MVLCARSFLLISRRRHNAARPGPLLKMKRFAIAAIDDSALDLEEEIRRNRQRRLQAYINRHEEPQQPSPTQSQQVSCTCCTTCSRRTKKKPGCVCKDAGVRCTAQCLCGTKKRGKITKQCKNGKVSTLGPNRFLCINSLSLFSFGLPFLGKFRLHMFWIMFWISPLQANQSSQK